MRRQQLIKLAWGSVGAVILAGSLGDVGQSQGAIDLTVVQQQALADHNQYRALHGSPAMTPSDALHDTAQAWAEAIARTGQFDHSTPDQRQSAGENLAAYYTTGFMDTETLANRAVQDWYDEIAQYDYGNPGFSGETGHFTQVVWKTSTQLGCGAAQGTKTINRVTYNAFYVVCHYGPAGNVRGQFLENVPRLQ